MNLKIIQIDEEKCIGCGLCANACKQSALKIIDGKAKLMSNDYCDGLGNCLPKCPVNAISFSNIDVTNKKAHKHALASSCPSSNIKTFDRHHEGDKHDIDIKKPNNSIACGCPSSNIKSFDRHHEGDKHDIDKKNSKNSLACGCPSSNTKTFDRHHESDRHDIDKKNSKHINEIQTSLRQWPVQIKLVPVNAPYFDNANLLIAADCTAYAYGNFHNEFMKNKITLIGCPKLDACDYADKLSNILENNNIQSVTIVRMEVPCCAGLENAVKTALKNCSKMIQWQLVTISTDGKILGERCLTL